MKHIATFFLHVLTVWACLLPPAQAQPSRNGHREYRDYRVQRDHRDHRDHRDQREYRVYRESAQRPMPPPERRMDWDERQRMREQVRNGQMSRDEARERWRERRGMEPVRSPEERERLRRDVIDANRELQRR